MITDKTSNTTEEKNLKDILYSIENGNISNFLNNVFKEAFRDKITYKNTLIYIKKVIYNKPAIIVFWSDDTKTVSVCAEEDTFDVEKGLLIAVLKKLTSTEYILNLFEDWGKMPNNEDTRTKEDVEDYRRRKEISMRKIGGKK